jgi:succinate dehydrogenase hydrophobic anchor subunit
MKIYKDHIKYKSQFTKITQATMKVPEWLLLIPALNSSWAGLWTILRGTQ